MMVYEIIILYDVKISKFDYDALHTMKRFFFKKAVLHDFFSSHQSS